MSLFRLKNKKQYTGDSKITLDAKHSEMMKHFENLRKSLPIKYKELEKLESQYNKLIDISNKDLSNDQLNKKFELADSISNLKKQIERIEYNEDEYDYFLNAGPLLYKYYDNIESIANDTKSKNNIMNFFNNNDNNNPKAITDYVTTTESFKRGKIRDEFFKIVDPNYIGELKYDKDFDVCAFCGEEKILMQSEGTMECQSCGLVDYVVVDCDKPSYKDPPPEVTYFSYKRRNHLREWNWYFITIFSHKIFIFLFTNIIIFLNSSKIKVYKDKEHLYFYK